MYLHFFIFCFQQKWNSIYEYHDRRVFLGYGSNKIFQKKNYSKSFLTKSADQVVAERASVLTRVRLCFMYVHKESSMAKCNKVNQYLNNFWWVLKLVMAFRMFQNTLLFVQTISFDFISSIVSYYNWVSHLV
jgi:hypothetical protein